MVVKMKKLLFVVSIFILSVFGLMHSANAEDAFFKNGNTYEQQCLHPSDAGMAFACGSYVEGMTDGMTFMKVALFATANIPFSDGPGECAPTGVTYKQSIDVLQNYIRNHPEIRHEDLAVIAASAWIEAWPCPKQAKLTTLDQCPKPLLPLQPKETCFAGVCFHWQ